MSDVERKDVDRIVSATREVNRVTGGGWKLGGAYLLTGEPGAGKSTLLLQELMDISNAEVDEADGDEPYEVLYASAEETAPQIATRGDRIGTAKKLYLFNQSDVLRIEDEICERDPDVVVTDSIQTMRRSDMEGRPGSISQVQACASHLVGLCKSRNILLIIIGHITKSGEAAGPETLEHLVDCTLMLEHDKLSGIRTLRARKNRFGSTEEMGVFRMTSKGLESVENPSELLLEAHVDGVSGVAIGVACAGLRPILVEIQCLLGPKLDEREGKRFCNGISSSRVAQLVAVLGQRCGIEVWDRDIYVNLPGGISVNDAALDLPLALAIASASLDYVLPKGFCSFGEVGLAGEVRQAPHGELRIKAAALMKMESTMGPKVGEEEIIVNDENALEVHDEVSDLFECFEILEWELTRKQSKKSKTKSRKKG